MAGRVAVVHAIHRGGAKTRCMDVHPSLPWVAFSDEHDCVVLFDWQCGRVLQEIGSGSGSLEESRLQVVPSWPRYLELSVLLKLSRINVKSRVSRRYVRYRFGLARNTHDTRLVPLSQQKNQILKLASRDPENWDDPETISAAVAAT
eukprot:5124327-Pyramimonas_sp.AAC.1